MPPRRRYSPRGFSEQVESEFDREFRAVIDKLDAEQSPASGTSRVSESRKVALWGLRDRRVDPDVLRQRLLAGGLGEEAQQMAVVQEYPEVLEVYAGGIANLPDVEDPEGLVDQLVRFAEWPWRWGTIAHLDDPDEQVREANRIEREWEKQYGTTAGEDERPAGRGE